MRNATVKQMIEELQKHDPDAIICRMEAESWDVMIYSTVEMVKPVGEVEYIDDAGDTKRGNVVAIY